MVLTENFYRAMALLITAGTLSHIQKMEKKEKELAEKFEKLLELEKKDDKVSSHKIICYYKAERNVSWRLQPEDIDTTLCTHLIVGFADVRQDFLVPRRVEDLEVFNRTVALKKKAKSLKVMLSLGARSGGRISKMVATFPGRERFIFSVLHFLDKYKFDGIDFDWEFPAWNGANPFERLYFTSLLKELHYVIEKSKKPVLVSVAVAAHVPIIDTSYDVPELAKVVDFVNLMSYDYRLYSPQWPFTAHHSPLFSRNSEKKIAYFLNVAWSAQFWEARGMPRSKIMVGMATHARTYKLRYRQVYGLDAPVSGPGLGNGRIAHPEVCDFLKLGAIQIFDISTKVPYAFLLNDWISFENVHSIFYKSKWVKEEGFGGIMVYNMNNDDWKGHCDNSTKFPLHKSVHKMMLR